MKSKAIHYVVIIFIGMVLVASAGIAIGIHSNTLVEWWQPAVICLAVGSGVALSFSRGRLIAKLTCTTKWYVNYAVPALAVALLLSAMFYSLNYFCADASTGHVEKALVESKYTEQRHRTRRVSRRTTVRGEPYNVYYLKLRFAGDKVKDVRVSPGQYSAVRKGDSMTYHMQRGLFGFPVIKKREVPVEHSSYRIK